MKIINVIYIMSGILQWIESFPIYEDSTYSEDTQIKSAEELFEKTIREFENLSDNEIEEYTENGYYSNMNGDDVIISWSNVNN